MIYSAGTIAISGAAVTGTGTNFTAAANQVRAGQTLLVLTSPPQIFEIATVNSDTSLTLTAAANPWLAAGTKYAILTTDALSVDGLAQSIAQLISDYDASSDAWETFAGTTANQAVNVTINGVAVSIPALGKLAQRGVGGAVPVDQGGTGATTQTAALTALLGNSAIPVANGGTGANTAAGSRTALGLGTAATRNVGTAQTNLPELGSTIFNVAGSSLQFASNVIPNFANTANQTRPPLQVSNGGNVSASAAMSFFRDGVYGVCFGLDATTNQFSFGGYSAGANSYRFWTEQNTVVDGNGFIKRASPVVKVYSDGSAELNAESAGVMVERLDTGVYRVSGVLGFNSDAGWGGVDGGIELPTDKNKLPLVWVDYEIEADGSILLKTFHRTHPTAPVFARNEIDGFSDGDAIDIPAGRCIDLRVEMPENSLWNIEQARLAEEMAQAFEMDREEGAQSQ
ncbi:phage tail protein [Atlantibacter subterranea]|uniref:phage tail fiber protein n=1 Tax=Atlantibacter subterraneus TaxID=255519 RepID=UPI0020C2ADE5|nr:phage tail protein [Atlantibacter subterranea]UTJ46102.1 phage tail protein [Atlantibacter subterranea]